MKVVHLNTQSYGGAAIVARRVHKELRAMGIDSLLLTRFGVRSKIEAHEFVTDATTRYFARKVLSREPAYSVVKYFQRYTQHPNIKNQPQGFELFSPLYRSLRFPRPDLLINADIVHLHWINNFIDCRYFFKEFSAKKFVWTLHDMNPITGGCHHSDGCMKFESNCMACKQLQGTRDENFASTILAEKKEGLRWLNDDQMIVVSPSKWIHDLAKQSQITGRFKNVHVPNPTFEISNSLLQASRQEIRKRLNLSLTKKIVLFVSDNLKNPRKGIRHIFEAASQMDMSDVTLVGIGQGAHVPGGLDVVFTGTIDDAQVLASYYYAADVFVLASMAENSPLVVIEALTCGTPVVASCVGGLTELVGELDGVLFEPRNSRQLASALNHVLYVQAYDRDAIMKRAAQRHDPLLVASQYRGIYESFLS